MFSDRFGDIHQIEKNLNMHYAMVRPIADRDYWDKMKAAGKEYILSYLESVRDFNYTLPATLYMEYARNGNRTNYENVHKARVATLMAHVILEAMDNDGSHMDDVVNFVWMLLEQTTWCFPAHKDLTPDSDALASTEMHSLDLIQAMVGCMMAFTYQLLKDKLDQESKFIAPRIIKEIKARVVDNFMERNDYWWQGFDESIVVNNWNPWILSNVLLCASVTEEDPARLAEIIRKVMICLDKYEGVYPNDGACDEGPGYWQRAGLSLLDCAHFLSEMTHGYVNVWNNEKIRNTAEYITKIQIGDGYGVNFADCTGKMFFARNSGTFLKYANITGSSALKALAFSCKKSEPEAPFTTAYIPPRVMDYLEIRAMEPEKIENPRYEKDTYFESVQVAIARESEDLSGLFLAAKGGHNQESHNHNDIGNIIVYKDKTPFIIDAGNETYCKKTFHVTERYDIWANQSGFHNVPRIAGQEQAPGREYKAEHAVYKAENDTMTFSVELKNAYKNREDMEHFTREIHFSRSEKCITLTDDFALHTSDVCEWMFITVCDVEETESGIRLLAPNGKSMEIQTDKTVLDVHWAPIDTQDALIMSDWGKAPTRIIFTLKEAQKKGTVTFTIR